MEKFAELAERLFNGMSILVEKNGEAAVSFGLEVFRWVAIGNLIEGLIFFLLGLMFAGICRWAIRKLNEEQIKHGNSEDGIHYFIAFCASTLLCGMCLIQSAVGLLNSWNYIGAVRPDIYAAKQVYEKVLKN